MTDQEINEAVARKLGWTFHDDPFNGNHWDRYPDGHGSEKEVPDYCHSIEAAWAIVPEIPYFTICQIGDFVWRVSWLPSTAGPTPFEQADTAPMAICRAFLEL